jgi:hypothetical protein
VPFVELGNYTRSLYSIALSSIYFEAEDGKGGLDLTSVDFDYKMTRAAQYSDSAVDFLTRLLTALGISLGAVTAARKLKPPKYPPMGFRP